MRIDRLEVGGGFLDGLRLTFADGLNVLIGPRGAGKTSVIELVRFALGVPAMTVDADKAARKQALAVLGDGTVSVFCSVQGEQLVFSRTGLDESPATSAAYSYRAPLIVSQNEIEAIGLDPASRREILDNLIDPLASIDDDGEAIGSTIASLESRLERLRTEHGQFAEKAAARERLVSALAEAEGEQSVVVEAAEKVKPLQDAIAQQADELGQTRAAAEAYALADNALGDWKKDISSSKPDRPLPRLASAALDAQVSAAVSAAHDHLAKAVSEIAAAQAAISSGRVEAQAEQVRLQERLKADAEKLEELQSGAGEVGRRVSTLRQQLQEQEGYAKRITQLEAEIATSIAERDRVLDEAERRSNERYQLRKDRAAALTSKFHARIEVRVDKSGEFAGYEAALVDALQGSNLQYKALAPTLAANVSPRELVAAVEASDPDRIVTAAGITRDRAVRLVAHLQQRTMAGLLLAPLEDSVDFALLDGQEYKPTRSLSMGQRCTVVLPLLLSQERDAILLDQPEDHLDNAFIVETLVEAVRERSATGQVIVATHNANVPVLGDAHQVIVLASDGRRGFATVCAPLDDDAAVDAITTLMEGGREAFAQRAAFYSAHAHE